MSDRSVWYTIWEFASLCMVIALIALAIMFAGCATPPRLVAIPHVCLPEGDSQAFQKCSTDCPDGDAFVIENRRDTACYCRKPHEM